MSDSERRFDLLRRGVGLFAGPVAFIARAGMAHAGALIGAHHLAAIASLVVIWWITEAIPIAITAMLGAALAAVFGLATPAVAFAPFADPIMFLFIGSFILSRAIVVHGVDARLAPQCSLTAATSMLVPVVISICLAAGVDPVAPAIGTCLGASLAFRLPISTPSNAIVYGTGLVPLAAMIRFGILMDVLGFFVIQIGLWILVPLLGHG